ncbi:MAG: hypothetical protein AABN33_21770 [Acidobacteriota bacterium]
MSYPANRHDSRIFESLKKCAPSAEMIGGGRWSFALANGKSFAVTARTVDEWFVLDAPLTDRIARGEMWDLLLMNASLEGLSKFVLMPDNRSVHLRADIPLLDEEYCESDSEGEINDDLTLRVLEACAGLKAAFRMFRGETSNEHALPLGAPPAPAAIPRESPSVQSEGADKSRVQELQRLCGDAGWPFIERSAGKLVVDLEARGGFYQALVEQRSAGADVSVEVALFDDLAPTSRQALSALLLKTGALVRLARPSIEKKENQIAARFVVGFATMPAAAELAHALCSLSVACSMCGREARAIKDETIARDYLAIAGIAPGYAEVREEGMLSAAN